MTVDHQPAGLITKQLTVLGGAGTPLAPLDLHVEPGQRIGLTATSVTDLSRLLAVLAGRDRPASGTVTMDGATVFGDAPPERVGYVSYEHRLIGTLTAAENVVALMLGRGSIRPADIWSRAEEQLAELGLPAASWHNLVEQLSGGQQQRVSLARALAGRPRLLVLDDPTSELDPDSAMLVADVLDRACAEGACCVLSSTDEGLLTSCTARVPIGSS
jgi:putative ABC transport system ATP-binding protein